MPGIPCFPSRKFSLSSNREQLCLRERLASQSTTPSGRSMRLPVKTPGAQSALHSFCRDPSRNLKLPDYMNWDEIRELHDAGITIGSQTHTHLHMAARGADASRVDGEAPINALSRSSVPCRRYSYPYGEAVPQHLLCVMPVSTSPLDSIPASPTGRAHPLFTPIRFQ